MLLTCDLLDSNSTTKTSYYWWGVIGIEMASIFNYFGSTVEVVEYADRIILVQTSSRLLNYLKQQGIKIHLNSKALKFENNQVEAGTKGKFS